MKKKIVVPFHKADIKTPEIKAVVKVLRSGWLTTAKQAFAFEKEFSDFLTSTPVGLPFAPHSVNTVNNIQKKDPLISLAVNSNTSGMILALKACGIKAGDVVLTSPYTFNSTPAAVVHLGADVDFCDIAPDSYNIDCNIIEQKLKKDKEHKIKAIIPVHIAGNVCDMTKINALAKEHGCRVIEDCAHAFPSLTQQGYAGTLGDIGVFSFYATKPITTGEGGMVTTYNKDMAQVMQNLRLHGMNKSLWDRYTAKYATWEYDITALGYKFNLPDILCAIGRQQLKKALVNLQKRKQIASIYNSAFAGNAAFVLPPDIRGNSWHLYCLCLRPLVLSITRNQFMQELQQRGVGVSMHFRPSFLMTYWKNKYPFLKQTDFPCAMLKGENSFSLPIWPGMKKRQVRYVVQCVLDIANKYKK